MQVTEPYQKHRWSGDFDDCIRAHSRNMEPAGLIICFDSYVRPNSLLPYTGQVGSRCNLEVRRAKEAQLRGFCGSQWTTCF